MLELCPHPRTVPSEYSSSVPRHSPAWQGSVHRGDPRPAPQWHNTTVSCTQHLLAGPDTCRSRPWCSTAPCGSLKKKKNRCEMSFSTKKKYLQLKQLHAHSMGCRPLARSVRELYLHCIIISSAYGRQQAM